MGCSKWGERFLCFSLVTVALIFFFPFSNEAMESEPGALVLSLEECIALALKRNPDIISEKLNPQIQNLEIIKEKAAFDPYLALETKENKSISKGTSILSGAGSDFWSRLLRWPNTLEEEQLQFNAGITEKIPTGGQYDLKFMNTRSKSNSIFSYHDEWYTSGLYFSLRQPLLKNFGLDINKTRIRIASNNYDISTSQLKFKVTAVILELQEIYWDFVAAIEDLEVRRQSLELAQKLLAQNKILVKKGRLPAFAILQAENAVANRKEGLLLSQNMVKEAQDRLKKMLDLLEEPEQKEKDILPADRPQSVKKDANVSVTYELALANRPELHQAKMALSNQELAFKYAKNQRLPKLDIVASYGLLGSDPYYRDNIDSLLERNTYAWEVGAILEIPLGNRSAGSQYLQEKIKLRQAQIKIDSTKKTILSDVKKVVREIETAKERVELTRTAKVLTEKKLKAEEERYKLGRSTTKDLLQFQEELSLAKNNENRATIDYQKSLCHWQAVTGRTIEENNIEIVSRESESDK